MEENKVEKNKMEENGVVREIPITEVEGLRIGNAQEAKTGVTVLLFDEGAKVGVDISGGGPASRETPLALPLTADNPVNGIVLSGGSAFGLAASDGVMEYLEERAMKPDMPRFPWYANPAFTILAAEGRMCARIRPWAIRPAWMRRKIVPPGDA